MSDTRAKQVPSVIRLGLFSYVNVMIAPTGSALQ